MKSHNIIAIVSLAFFCVSFAQFQTIDSHKPSNFDIDILLSPAIVENDSIDSAIIPLDKSSGIGSHKIHQSGASNFLAHMMGLPLLSENQDTFKHGLAHRDLLEHPKSNMVVYVDGLSADNMAHFKSIDGSQAMLMSNEDIFHSSASNLNSLLSGKSQMEHRVLPKSMSSQGVNEHHVSAVSRVQDLLSQKYPNSLVLSYSSDPELANMANIHPSLAGDRSTFTLDSENRVSAGFSYEDLLQSLSSSFDLSSFDLNKQVDEAFLVELATILRLTENPPVELNEKMSDGAPDMFNFVLTGFKSMMKQYGASSQQVAAALRLIDQVVPKVWEKFAQKYPSRASAQLVLAGASTELPTIPNQVSELVRKRIGSSQQIVTPFVSLPSVITQSEVMSICSDLQRSLPSLGFKAECGSHTMSHGRSLSEQAKTPHYGLNDIDNFNIVLVSTLLLLIIAYIGIYALWYMDVGQDTLLYSKLKTD